MRLSRREILNEMGISPHWVLRGTFDESCAEKEALPAGAAAYQEEKAFSEKSDFREIPVASSASSASSSSPAPFFGSTVEDRGARAREIAGMDWDRLRRSIAACRACGLCADRKQAVPGVGDEKASWMFIGEGPGAEEDARGEPFVGQAGKLLDAMLGAIDLKRGEDVYIANAVKCRPPGNRTPEAAEIAACFPYLKRQIELVSPKLIVLLGRVAVSSALGNEGTLSALRGKGLRYAEGEIDIPVVVTYHPAYLLRNLPDKAKAWEDLCRARALIRALLDENL
jgi:DNA polymerase